MSHLGNVENKTHIGDAVLNGIHRSAIEDNGHSIMSHVHSKNNNRTHKHLPLEHHTILAVTNKDGLGRAVIGALSDKGLVAMGAHASDPL